MADSVCVTWGDGVLSGQFDGFKCRIGFLSAETGVVLFH
jgi:hypothetical protein